MNNKKTKFNYNIIFISVFMIILAFPYFNCFLHLIKNEPLFGVNYANPKPDYHLKNYFSGEYQKDFDKYYLENFPYRNVYIKMYNQLRYNLFDKGTPTITVGKDNYLFENVYIEEYLGLFDLQNDSEEYMQNVIDDLKVIDKICKENGKEVYVLITPSKASFLPEYIPDRYYKMVSDSKKYERYYYKLADELKSNNIKYFDSVKYINENEFDEPVFYKTGIHWSYLTAARVLSEFINYINNSSSLKLPEIKIVDTEKLTEEFFGVDVDIYSLLNIYNGEKDDFYYYPVIEYDNTDTNNANLLMQGGSFCWNILEYMDKVFDNIDFMYYHQMIRKYTQDGTLPDITINESLEADEIYQILVDKDLIVLEINEENIRYWKDCFVHELRTYLEENGFPK